MVWAAQVKLLLYATLIIGVFLPWGIATSVTLPALSIALFATLGKLAGLGVLLAGVETVLAKLRLFRAPALLNLALLLGLLGLLSHVILEVGT
jgi:formate hydrogenlyase subunit 4